MSPLYTQITESSLFKKIIKQFFQSEEYEIVERPASFSVRLKEESSEIVKRIILLPPHGFTADKINLLSPHPEARNAKIRILGKIKPQNRGLAPVKQEIKFVFSLIREIPTEKDSSYSDYFKFSKEYYKSQLKSWRSWFYVVKENGWGNFHNLINLSDDWVILLLEKNLIDRKEINIDKFLKQLTIIEAERLKSSLKQIERDGDKIFRDVTLVENILILDLKILVPILIRMLNSSETGKHEPCTFFALLLKAVKKDKKLVLKEVNKSIKMKIAPRYYLEDLKNKLVKH
ncbi:MAG: hypothetical protein WC863_00035 [Patescibacteria group bacterium]